MSAPICLSDTQAQPIGNVPHHARARGELKAEFAAIGPHTRIGRVYEAGGLRLRYPKTQIGCEAVIINTGGGIIGGDQSHMSFEAGPRSHVILTTQAAEKVYRAQSQDKIDQAQINVDLILRADACLEWLPQETILFQGSSLKRNLNVHMEALSSLTLLETTLFGRLAMGETDVQCDFRDRWRIYRQGALIFADDIRLQTKDSHILDRKAAGSGTRAMATLLYIAQDSEQRCEAVRTHLHLQTCQWGVSAWNGFLLIRLVSAQPDLLRRSIVDLLRHMRGCEAPRVWN